MNRSLIPPYILDRIIGHGSEHQRDCARNTLQHIASLRHNNGKPRPNSAQARQLRPAPANRRIIVDFPLSESPTIRQTSIDSS